MTCKKQVEKLEEWISEQKTKQEPQVEKFNSQNS